MNNNNEVSILKLELLEKEYTIILNQYEEAYKNYLSSISKENEFIAIKRKTWWGKQSLNQKIVTNKDECITMCANDDKCSGATFNEKTKYCWTRIGDGNITNGKEDEYALITKVKSDLVKLNYLNNKLIEINKEIIDIFNNIDIDEINSIKIQKQEELNNNYKKLANEHDVINKMLEKYNDIEASVENQELYVNQENSNLKLWVLITFIILLITLNQLFIGQTIPARILFKILLVIILVIMSYSLSTRHGFIIIIILLLVIFLMTIGIIPFPFNN
jgi:hypothetical protein